MVCKVRFQARQVVVAAESCKDALDLARTLLGLTMEEQAEVEPLARHRREAGSTLCKASELERWPILEKRKHSSAS